MVGLCVSFQKEKKWRYKKEKCGGGLFLCGSRRETWVSWLHLRRDSLRMLSTALEANGDIDVMVFLLDPISKSIDAFVIQSGEIQIWRKNRSSKLQVKRTVLGIFSFTQHSAGTIVLSLLTCLSLSTFYNLFRYSKLIDSAVTITVSLWSDYISF